MAALALGGGFALLDMSLARSGAATWDFSRNLNGSGSATFDLFAAMLIAVMLRIVAFVVTLALLVPRASFSARLQTALLLVLLGGMSAFLALPTFGLSILAFALAAYYAFFALSGGRGATEAILGSFRIAAKNLPATGLLIIVPVAAAVSADALLRALHLPVAATFAGWMTMELVLVWCVSRASVLYEGWLHK